jgi:hypothetical protein
MLFDISEITAIEDRYTVDGAPSLGDAYAALVSCWESDVADREECLRLMFLSWYACSEPGFLTGLPEGSKAALFGALFEHFGGEQTTDAEVMFTVGIMASTFPYCCGDKDVWAVIGRGLKQRYHDLPLVGRLSLSQLDGRGAYGKYFGHMLARETTS